MAVRRVANRHNGRGGHWASGEPLFDALRYDAADVLGEPERVERLTNSKTDINQELVELSERDLVQNWMREIGPHSAHMVFVHRGWGTVSAVPDREAGVDVFWTDGTSTWHAVPPGAPDNQALTPGQVERIILDATTSSGPPEWPDWKPLWGPAAYEAVRSRRKRSRPNRKSGGAE
jgi:hypothetical protein